MIAGRDPNGAGGLFAKSAERRQLRSNFIEMRTDGSEQPLACFGWRNTAGRAGEKPEAKARLEPAYGLAKG